MLQVSTAPQQQQQASDAYTARQVAKLFGLTERQLRYWSQTGFIRPSLRRSERAVYSFRDLISVKVAKALIDDGVPLRRVRRSLASLARKLPGSASLANLRVRCEGDQVVIEEEDYSFEADTGQLVLEFHVAELRAEAADVVSLPFLAENDDVQQSNAYDWFLQACELEQQWGGAPADQSGFEAARQAYERTLELDPNLGAAWTNLGSMLAEIGDLEAARTHFDKALRCDSDQPEAHCNLAELSLREGDAEGAITGYRQLLRLSPDWAEAHYGLARALLEVGGRGQALAHLERFCTAVDRTPPDGRTPDLQARRDSAAQTIERLRDELLR